MCKFFINSLTKVHGRTLTMEVWNNRNSDSQVGFGVFDLEPVFNMKNKKAIKKSDRKCFINYENKPGGFIETNPTFKPEPYHEISSTLISAQIRVLKP